MALSGHARVHADIALCRAWICENRRMRRNVPSLDDEMRETRGTSAGALGPTSSDGQRDVREVGSHLGDLRPELGDVAVDPRDV